MHPEPLTLYFHIGQPKTGSSAIQAFLDQNRELLFQNAGLLYPNFEGNNYIKGDCINHAAYFEKTKVQSREQECIDDFGHCIKFCMQSNIRKVIISNEGFFWKWWPALIRSIKDTHKIDTKLILYLRRQDYFIESGWKQWGHKNPAFKTINDYAEQNVFDWNVHLKPWLDAFSPADFIVFPFEKDTIGEDVVAHFMQIFNVSDISKYSQPKKNNVTTNYGFSPEIIQMMRLCDWNLKNINDHALIHFLAESLPMKFIKTDPFAPYGILSPKQRFEIVSHFQPSNLKLEALFHHTTDKCFFSEALPDPNETWTDKSTLTIENITPVMMGLLFRQHQEIQNLKKTIRQAMAVRSILSGADSEKIIYLRQIKQLVRHKDSIEFVAKGNDPVILLPRMQTKDMRLMVSVTMTAPSPSVAQIFFKTRLFQRYEESRSVRQKTNAGLNTIRFELADQTIAGRLRFDPGCHPGKYIIHRIEISQFT